MGRKESNQTKQTKLGGMPPNGPRREKNSEYDEEISQSQTADSPIEPRGRATQPSRDTRKTN